MAFDLIRFFDQHGVRYNVSGANTSRGNVTIHCPWCGADDPSEHLSVSTDGKGFKCWRHPQHRGKNPARLVRAILGCTMDRAREIVGQSIFIPTDFAARVKAKLQGVTVDERREALTLPDEFRSFGTGKPSARIYENYLLDRGFTFKQIDRLSKRYGVYYAHSGAYKGRIIFTIYFDDELVAWTGRTVSERQELRYKALSVDPERATREGYKPALGAISHYLLWYDDLMACDADTIVMCEGPFDALKVDVLGYNRGVAATCFFTAAPTDAQIDLLHEVLPRFKRRILLLDRGTLSLAMKISRELSSLGVRFMEVPKGLKDPGEFTASTFDDFLLAVERRTH